MQSLLSFRKFSAWINPMRYEVEIRYHYCNNIIQPNKTVLYLNRAIEKESSLFAVCDSLSILYRSLDPPTLLISKTILYTSLSCGRHVLALFILLTCSPPLTENLVSSAMQTDLPSVLQWGAFTRRRYLYLSR